MPIFSEQRLFERFRFSKSEGVFVDVGANVGAYTDHFAKKGWHVVALEPSSALHERLDSRHSNNDNVFVLPVAAGESHGVLPWYESDSHPGIHSLAKFHQSHSYKGDVEVKPLSEILSDVNVLEVDALKIDAEGADVNVLRGFDPSKHSPKLVMCEYFDDRSLKHFGTTHHDAATYMSEYGYSTWISEWTMFDEYASCDGNDNHKSSWLGIRKYSGSELATQGNLVFVKPEDETLLNACVRMVKAEMKFRATARMIPGVAQISDAFRMRSAAELALFG